MERNLELQRQKVGEKLADRGIISNNPFGVLAELQKEDLIQEELEKNLENPKSTENPESDKKLEKIKKIENSAKINSEKEIKNEISKTQKNLKEEKPRSVMQLINSGKIVNRLELLEIFRIFKTEFQKRMSETDRLRSIDGHWKEIGLRAIPNEPQIDQNLQKKETLNSENLENSRNQEKMNETEELESENQNSKNESSQTTFSATPTASQLTLKSQTSKPLSKKQKKKQQKKEAQLKTFITRLSKFNKPTVTIGMVGFPNVGKSSLINTLCEAKKVGVDSKPGKTKNFQTIPLDADLTLCDCPGLVMPSLASSSAEMVCKGVLPISNLIGFVDPMRHLMKVSDYQQMSNKYFLPNVDEEGKQWVPSAREVLQIFAASRGVVTGGSGIPDEHQAAKILLRDLVDGKIVYFKLPPNVEILKSEENLDSHKNIFKKKSNNENNFELDENKNKKPQTPNQIPGKESLNPNNKKEISEPTNPQTLPDPKKSLLQQCFDSMPGPRHQISLQQVQKTFKNVDLKDIETFAKQIEEREGDDQMQRQQENLLLLQFIDSLTAADIEALLKGEKIGDYKLNKTQRRQLKFAISSGQSFEELEKLFVGFFSSGGKKNKKDGKKKGGKRKARKAKVKM